MPGDEGAESLFARLASGRTLRAEVRMLLRFVLAVSILVVSVGIVPAGSATAIDKAQGPQIAFSTDRDGNSEVYVVDAGGGTPVNVTRHPAADTSPTWSPDGSRIAFVSDRDGNPDIWVMAADGGAVVNLTASSEHERDPVWSPDGSRIAYSADGSVLVIDVTTERRTMLTVPDPQLPGWGPVLDADDAQPTWSPEGDLIAFVRHYSGPTPTAQTTAFFTVPANGRAPATHLAAASWAVAGLDWSPDGASIVWGEVSTHNTWSGLRRLDVASGTNSSIDVSLGFTHYEEPTLSSDGTGLAFVAYTLNKELATIYVWHLDETDPPRRLTTDPAWDTDPAWGPWSRPVGLVDTASGRWTLKEGAVEIAFYFGNPGDFPFVGDWDCDGDDTPGMHRPSDGFIYLRTSNTQGVADVSFYFGNPSDVPLAGDFNGDGCDTVSIYRPSEARFYIINELGNDDGGLGAADYSFLFGNVGDNPVVGDWDGDGVDEIGLHRESTGFFYYRNTLTTGIADGHFYFGNPSDRLVSGDWGGVEGQDTPAIFRPSNTAFYFRDTLTQGIADSQFTWAGAGSAWLPVAGTFGLD
jgi:Tol biopolymer transport system component